MKMSKIVLTLMLALLFTCVLATHNSSKAALVNWVEVTRFSGIGSDSLMNTTDFTVSYPEWRILWEYTPDTEYPENAGLTVMAYSRTEPGGPVNEIFALGTANKTGTSNVHNKTGIFYLTIATSPDVLNYTLIIEQDIDSVPEYPLLTLALLVFVVTSLIMASIGHRSRDVRVKRSICRAMP
jgi:hypothetical protein